MISLKITKGEENSVKYINRGGQFLGFYLEEDEVIVGKRLSGSKIGIFPNLKIVIYILEITN